MDIATWSSQLQALQSAIERLQRFFVDRDPATTLAPADLKTLEHLFDQYLRADKAVASQIEFVLRRSTKRPRR